MANIIDFDGSRAARYIERAIDGFSADPPDSEFQRGYLAALLAVYREAVNGRRHNTIIAAEALLDSSAPEE